MNLLMYTRDLSIGYALKKHPPLIIAENIRLDLFSGELVCLIGPNGSGKSTLLRTIAGLQPPLQGDVFLAEKNVKEYSPMEKARYLSLVLTTPVQVGQLRVYDLIGLGRYPYTDWAGNLSPQDHSFIQRSLSAVDIESFSQRFIHELSDGERQKVMIARALAQTPKVIILDEPTAFLDFPFRIEILTILREITRSEKKGILLSTHDLDLAMRLADRLWIIGRDGVFHAGAPEDMVLNGVISDVFTTRGVSFDSDNGQFTLPSACLGSILISGENGRSRFWTIRALHRMGYMVDEKNDPVMSIHISSHNSGLRWNVRSHTGEVSFMNLTDLTRWIANPKTGAS